MVMGPPVGSGIKMISFIVHQGAVRLQRGRGGYVAMNPLVVTKVAF